MKKNVMMRVAAMLLVCVMATTCGISGTFAKYVTEGSSDDFARVARFGVTVTANFADLFAYEYATHTNHADDADKLTVKSIFGGDVVAPGTTRKMADFTVIGRPEVDVMVTYTVDFELGDNWMVDTNDDSVVDSEYCPLVISVNGKFYYIGGTDLDGNAITSVNELELAVEAAIVASNKYYNAGDDLSVIANDLEVSWKWHFEGSAEHVGGTGPACQWDKFDTQLGNAFNATVSLDITCTVTQVD